MSSESGGRYAGRALGCDVTALPQSERKLPAKKGFPAERSWMNRPDLGATS